MNIFSASVTNTGIIIEQYLQFNCETFIFIIGSFYNYFALGRGLKIIIQNGSCHHATISKDSIEMLLCMDRLRYC